MQHATTDELIERLQSAREEINSAKEREERLLNEIFRRLNIPDAHNNAQRRANDPRLAPPQRGGPRGFRKDDRVYITNRVTPFGREENVRDRLCTVTNPTLTRVYLRTDNGAETWRIRKNIRFATDRDEQRGQD